MMRVGRTDGRSRSRCGEPEPAGRGGTLSFMSTPVAPRTYAIERRVNMAARRVQGAADPGSPSACSYPKNPCSASAADLKFLSVRGNLAQELQIHKAHWKDRYCWCRFSI